MTVAIKGCINKSDVNVTLTNPENPSDNRTIQPKATNNQVYAWIPQHKDKALSIKTKKGTCKIWDQDWKIMYQWNAGPELSHPIKSNQIDYLLYVNSLGEISLNNMNWG